MRTYGRLLTGFFNDPDVQALSLPSDTAYLYAYFLAGRHHTAIGCYFCPPDYVKADLTTWTIDQIKDSMNVLHKKKKVMWDKRVNWVWVRRYLAHNDPTPGNGPKACLKAFNEIPEKFRYRVGVLDSMLEFIRFEAIKKDDFGVELEHQLLRMRDAIRKPKRSQKNTKRINDLDLDSDSDPDGEVRIRSGSSGSEPARPAPFGGGTGPPEGNGNAVPDESPQERMEREVLECLKADPSKKLPVGWEKTYTAPTVAKIKALKEATK